MPFVAADHARHAIAWDTSPTHPCVFSDQWTVFTAAGLEYTAKYNLNYTVPFVPNCGAYPSSGWCFKNISAKGRGDFSSMWEMAAAVYGDLAPYTQKVVTS